jgi:phage-related protein
MAVSAINLNDTMSSLAGPIVENCDLMQNFFGSVLGSGAELLGKIQSTIFGVLGTINGTIQSAVNAATGIVSQIQALTNQAIAMVTNEIAAFAEWIGKQMDFALGSFMASLGDISGCAGLVGDVVKTSALSNIL